MSATLPPEIEVIESPEGGVLYRLSRRPSAVMRLAGLVPVAFGAFILSWPLLGIVFFFVFGAMDGEQFWPALLLPLGCFGPVCFPLGGFFFGMGLLVLFGRTEVRLGDGRLKSVERWGWLRWGASRSLDQITGFHIAHNDATPAPHRPAAAWGGDVGQLVAVLGDGRKFTVCTGYPRAWLVPLADELARGCEAESPPENAADVHTIGVSEENLDPERIEERSVKPQGSPALIEERTGGATITIPPQGLRGCDRFAVLWVLVWNGIVGVMAPVFLYLTAIGEMKWENGPDRVSLPFMCLFMSPFVLIAVGGLLWLIHQMRRSALIDMDSDRLEVRQTGVFGTSQRSWSRDELAGVGVQSKLTTGESSTWETRLCVRPVEGSPVYLLGHRPKAELEWIATLMRKTMRIENIPDPVLKSG